MKNYSCSNVFAFRHHLHDDIRYKMRYVNVVEMINKLKFYEITIIIIK